MIKACNHCAYRKYVGDGHSMCTHKKMQQTLACQGTISFRQGKMLDRCPAMASKIDPEMEGVRDHTLLRRTNPIKKLAKAKTTQKQGRLF